MAEYCLTTSVSTVGGTIKQPGCSWAEKGFGESCAANHGEGTVINIFATPSSGYQVYHWACDIGGIIPPDSDGNDSITITMPSQDIEITVSFNHANVDLILQVGAGDGCISLVAPSSIIDCSGGSVSLPAGEVRVKGTPDEEWEISHWTLDGSIYNGTNSEVDVNLIGYSQRVITVYFQAKSLCF